MPLLTVDGTSVEVSPGATVIEAADSIGIGIPALCRAEGLRPLTSCMLCVVKETGSGRMMPSCSARAEEGMAIVTQSDDVRTARREILELLLSEHAGDCEAPCRHMCPASLDISSMMRRLAAGDVAGAARIARDQLTIPATLGNVCPAPCERGCHRGSYDSPLCIRELHRQLGVKALESGLIEPAAAASGKRVAIIGASAAGLAAACVLLRQGHGCSLFDKADTVGRMVREYAEGELDPNILDVEVESIRRMGAEFNLGHEISDLSAVHDLLRRFDAVLVTCDGMETDRSGVFHAVEYPMTVTAVAEGKAAADQVHRHILGRPSQRHGRVFNSRLGPLRPAEFETYRSRCGASGPNLGSDSNKRMPDHPDAEAARCLHCECLKPVSCLLRRYAEEYGARQTAFRLAERPNVEKTQHSDIVAFEPGKCIKCGICVEIGRQEGELSGMSFVERGYSTRVRAPFGRTLEDALKKSARRSIQACPTGALAYRRGEASEP